MELNEDLNKQYTKDKEAYNKVKVLEEKINKSHLWTSKKRGFTAPLPVLLHVCALITPNHECRTLFCRHALTESIQRGGGCH